MELNPITIPDGCIIDEVKLNEIKSWGYLADKLKIYKRCYEKWHCLNHAAYLYLTNPDLEAGYEPFGPKQIIFSESSSGGGLAVDTALMLRDIVTPSDYNIISSLLTIINSKKSLSVVLTCGMPSFMNPEMDKTDWLHGALKIPKLGPSMSI
ncbi:alpha/beta-hydrolase [Gigaspora margarita]|uniref:Alpha/beta-hydrolase n=1 Tax=Gigaspora margarita TaxID=4874 RepID=A0A8H4B0L1_GIGMA|nr:alpha/beta-hydrolase [Gigaspora margarita]